MYSGSSAYSGRMGEMVASKLCTIFDMDGTMFDTERLRFKTLKQAAEEIYGTP